MKAKNYFNPSITDAGVSNTTAFVIKMPQFCFTELRKIIYFKSLISFCLLSAES